jgi:hypothetical protein
VKTARRLGLIGGGLGLVAGTIELTIGSTIRSWVGDKQDTTRLGIVTILLALTAAAAANMLGRPASASSRLVCAAGLLVPGLVGYTTVGRLWWLPGALLITAGLLTGRDARQHTATAGRHLTRILCVVLALIYVGLGLSAHGIAAVAGILGGIIATAAAATRRLPGPIALALLTIGALPFATITWWSVVTPLLAALILVLGFNAILQPTRRRLPANTESASPSAGNVEQTISSEVRAWPGSDAPPRRSRAIFVDP